MRSPASCRPLPHGVGRQAPQRRFSRQALRLARAVRLLVLDVDGVLTENGLFYLADGSIAKRFCVADGLGIKLAQAAGLEVAVITGLNSRAVETRVRELGITEYFAGHLKKGGVLQDIAQRRGYDLREMAYLGDDWVDLTPLRLVGLPMVVADAAPELFRLAAWVARTPGGHGAVREAVRFLLLAQGRLAQQFQDWS